PHRKIITLEDPVEYRLAGVSQCNVKRDEEGNINFQEGLVACLRCDPDVIMLGEIRSPEVAATAMQAAMTGHLVLSTIHANSAIATVSRLRNLGIASYLINSSLLAISAQRLIRSVCPHCAQEKEFTPDQIAIVQKTFQSLKARQIELPEQLPHSEKVGKGCEYCNFSGYLGRLVVSEILVISEKMQELIRTDVSEKELIKQAVADGLITMKEDSILKVIWGETNLNEALRI
nr:ATPase, T2SS/T4P/T4SS family [Candidatus Gracilibacteria bacterium]